MPEPRDLGNWPLGPFPDTPAGRVAKAAGEMAFVVRALRRRRGLSQSALASRADVTRQTVSSLERGEFLPKLDSVMRVLVALDVPPRLDVFSDLVADPELFGLGTRAEE